MPLLTDLSTLPGAALHARPRDLGANNSSALGWVNRVTGIPARTRAPGAAFPPLVKTGQTPALGKVVEWPAGKGMTAPSGTAGTSFDFGPVLFTGHDVACVYASSLYDEQAYPASCAIDGNAGTTFMANATSFTYTIQLLTAKVVTGYTITSSNSGRAPRDWTFQGSNDGSSWTTLDTQTAQTFPGGARTFSFSNPTAYTYYQWTITANNEASGNTMLAELGLTGATLVGTPATAVEAWVAAKAPATNSAIWQNGYDNAWFPNVGAGLIYESWALANGAGWTARTPVLAIANTWRLYRIAIDNVTWTSWLDNTVQDTKSASTAVRPHLIIGGGYYGNPLFSGGQMGDVFVRRSVSSAPDVADIKAYYNNEIGLTVAGASAASGPGWGIRTK